MESPQPVPFDELREGYTYYVDGDVDYSDKSEIDAMTDREFVECLFDSLFIRKNDGHNVEYFYPTSDPWDIKGYGSMVMVHSRSKSNYEHGGFYNTAENAVKACVAREVNYFSGLLDIAKHIASRLETILADNQEQTQ